MKPDIVELAKIAPLKPRHSWVQLESRRMTHLQAWQKLHHVAMKPGINRFQQFLFKFLIIIISF